MIKNRTGKIKIFLFSLMVIIFCGILLIFRQYRQAIDPVRDMTSSAKDGVNVSLQRVYQTASKDGATAWKLNAESVSYMNGKQQAVFEKPFLTFFLNNEKEARLKAGRGTVRTDTNDLQMDGNVIMENGIYILETQELKYQHDKRIFYTEVPVKICGEDMELSADSATLDLNAGKMFFRGHVKGTFGENISL